MKKVFISLFALAAVVAAKADNETITLDLTKAQPALTFDATTGAWTGTYDDDETSIDCQVFSFIHNSMGEYKTWWGFTASNSADNTRKEDTMTYQFSNMAKGGIVLNEDGTVKKDSYGAPVVSASVPYIVSYASPGFAKHPASVVFNDNKLYEPVGVYVNLNSYPYYCMEYGDSFARAFTEGDKFTLSIIGVAADESETTVETVLCSYTNGDLSINRGWKYVDLSSLGAVNEIYFSLKSTDVGQWGDNTPSYFCLDKLSVKPATGSSVSSVKAENNAIRYDRESKTVSVGDAGFAMVFDVAGASVMSSDEAEFSVASLPAGVYIVKAGDASLKIAR